MALSTTHDIWSVIAESGQGQRLTAELEPGKNLFVGSSDHCGLQLSGDDISSLQCLITLEGTTVSIQDWASKSGTHVNGEPIAVKTDLSPRDKVCVGGYRIRFQAQSAALRPTAPPNDVPSNEAPSNDVPSHDTPSRDAPSSDARPLAVPTINIEPSERVSRTLPEAKAEVSEEIPRVDAAPFGFDDDLFEAESFDQETVQLLRAEIEDLQAALAQRDEQIESLLASPESAPTEQPADELEQQSEAMLQRLQDLLDEAECHDERVALLEEQLQTAEEAHQAEQEERTQLETWVGDIERRIGEREEEWKAESDALRQQVEQAREERDRVQHQLRDAASQGTAPDAYQETLDRLQAQNGTLQQELDAAGKEIASLQQRLERAENRDEETLRDERAAVARDRAEVARLRHELQRQLAQSQALPEAKEQPDREFSDRLKALREHLKEIHQEEQVEREQRGSPLASRISRLWKRLEY